MLRIVTPPWSSGLATPVSQPDAPDAPVSYDFFVAPNGGTGAGSFESPWSLAYAWGTGSGSAQGDGKLPAAGSGVGKRIALRGGADGVQEKYNISSSIALATVGSIGSGVDNPDGKLIWEGYRTSTHALQERACIYRSGNTIRDYFMLDGDYNWLLNLETAGDWADRDNGANAGACMYMRGTHNGFKIAHCDNHDGGNGVYMGDATDGQDDFGRVDIYANYIRNQGWDANGTPTSSAHGLYIHHKSNSGKRLRIEENILGSTFALCCQLYASDVNGHVEDIDYNGNVHFNGYVLSSPNWPTDGNLLVLGGEQALSDIVADDNFFFWPDGYGDQCIIASYRGSASVNQGVLTIRRPYCRGGGSGYGMVNVRGHFATRSNFTLQDGFFRDGRVGNRGMIRFSDTNPAGFNMSGNLWARAASDLAWASNNTGSYAVENIVRRRFSGTLPNWSNDTGLSAGSTQSGDPTVNAVFVRPTLRFFPNRGNVIIYNWEALDNVSVNLNAILGTGDRYAVYDNRDTWHPIFTGTYDGVSVSFPMNTQVTDPTPIGGFATGGSAAPATIPYFNAFVVRRRP